MKDWSSEKLVMLELKNKFLPLIDTEDEYIKKMWEIIIKKYKKISKESVWYQEIPEKALFQ